jgi:hypothetical protein
VPTELASSYDQGRTPGDRKLLLILENVLRHFDTVFLVVDALDETKPQQPLLELMRTLVSEPRFRNIQLLTTSREHRDIEEVMSGISISVPMDHDIIRHDIRAFVRSLIEKGREFRRWPRSLRNNVEDRLTHGANGM